MFHQVRVCPEDASAYRYFWREPGSAEPPDVFEFLVHLFGATSSPSVCCYALQQAVKDSGPHWEELLEQLKDQFYMDNWATSFADTQVAVRTGRLLIDAQTSRLRVIAVCVLEPRDLQGVGGAVRIARLSRSAARKGSHGTLPRLHLELGT